MPMTDRARKATATAAGMFVLLLAGCRSAAAPVLAVRNPDAVVLSGDNDRNGKTPVSPSAVSGSGGTLLAVPSRDQLKKNSLEAEVLDLLETGSPASIKLAVERINTDVRGMTDQNRIALAVAGELMQILYPLEPVTWTIPAVPENGTYIGAVRSARLGVYDYNTGNADFLSLVLPSLVLAVTTTPGNYYADAATALVKASSRNPRSVLPPYFRALLAARQGKPAEAAGLYRRAWELDASCYPAGIARVNSLIAEGSGMAALDVARTLAARYPENIPVRLLCADAAFAARDWDAADSHVLKVLMAEPGNTRVLLMRARILVERREYLKANSLLDAFATTNRTDKNYLLLRSRVIREWNKNSGSAAAVLQEAQQLYPDDVEVLLSSAEVCYQSGLTINRLGGRDFVRLVLAKDATNRSALSLLVADHIAQSEWESAVAGAEQLVSLHPSTETRVLLLRSWLGAGQSAKAASLAKTLYGVPPPTDEITALYLRALVESGDARTASSVIASRLGDAPSSLKSVLYYYESRLAPNSDARLSSLRSSLLADPRNVQGLFAMYEWYFEKSDYRKAQYYLKQVIALDPANSRNVRLLANLDELLAR